MSEMAAFIKKEPMTVGQLKAVLSRCSSLIEVRIEGEYRTAEILGVRIVGGPTDEKVLHLQTDIDDD